MKACFPNQRLVDRYRNIANVIGGRSDIYVHIAKGGVACFDGKNCITLPDGDFSDPEWTALCEGYINHEAGHVRFTDVDFWRQKVKEFLSESDGFINFSSDDEPMFTSASLKALAIRNSNRLHWLINLFDDVQMEYATGNSFPRAKLNLARTYAILSKKGYMGPDLNKPDPNPVDLIDFYILNKLRTLYLGQQGHEPTVNELVDYVNDKLAPIIGPVNDIIDKAIGIQSTYEAYERARELYDFFKSYIDENDDLSEPESSENQDDTGDENSSDSQDQSQSGSDNEDPSNDCSSQDNCNDSTDKEKQSNFSQEAVSHAVKTLKGYMNDDKDGSEYHECIGKVIDIISEEVSEETLNRFGATNPEIPDVLIDETVYDKAQAQANSVHHHLSFLLNVKTRDFNKTAERGTKIDSKRLPLVPLGVKDVYKRRTVNNQTKDVALVLLRDISGSMRYQQAYQLAIETDLTLALACQKIPRLHLANVVFPYFDSCLTVKAITQSVEEVLLSFGHAYSGDSTPTSMALKYASDLLLRTNYKRKIILLITDGEPTCDESDVLNMVKLANSQGVETAGVGINSQRVIGFSTNSFVTITDASLLCETVKNLVLRVLAN